MIKNILEKLFGNTPHVVTKPTNFGGSRKECRKCSRVLAVTEFNRHNKRPDGLQCWCKDCMSQCKPGKKRISSTRMRRIREGQKLIKLSFAVTPEQRIILDEICRGRKTTISKMINAVVQMIVHEHKTNITKSL